jgi:hypothetical protein
MEIEFIILIVALTVISSVAFFSIYRIVTFVFLKKVVTYIMEPIGVNKYHVLARIKKRIGTEVIKYDDGLYPLDTKFSVTDKNNSELLFFKHGSSKPLTFFEAEKGNAKLLKTFTKTKVWQGIFGVGGETSFIFILIIICGASLLMTFYLMYSNNQLNTQIQLLQTQLATYYNATKTNGGIVIGK